MSSLPSMLLMLPALAAVLALVWLAQLAYRAAARSGLVRPPPAAAGAARLELVQVLALDSRRRVQLLRCDRGHVLLLTGGPQDLVLRVMPANEPGARP